MKVAIVNSSELVKEKRWDAGFYFALDPVRARVQQLMELYPRIQTESGRTTNPEILDRLAKFKPTQKAVLLVLSRRHRPKCDADTFGAIEKEYPYVSLALLEASIDKIIDDIKQSIEQQTNDLRNLTEIEDKARNGK
jgi:hypothetical protein